MSYTFTPSAISDPSVVKQLELDLAAVRPLKPRNKRWVSYERYGLANLCLPGNDPYTGPRPYVVRIYYKSIGGEVVCCDSDHLSRQKAENLYRQYNKSYTDAVGALLLPVENGKVIKTTKTKGCREPRLIVLPSQMQISNRMEHPLQIAA